MHAQHQFEDQMERACGRPGRVNQFYVFPIAVAHPEVAMAPCIGMAHPKWDERPIVVVVKKAGVEISRDELIQFYVGKTAKWQIPDDIVFMQSIQLGPTEKSLKTWLREQLHDFKLPGV